MRNAVVAISALWVGMFVVGAHPRAHGRVSPANPGREPRGDRPLAEKLRSPRETLQTLYYAVDVYDYFPSIIADAVACLDLGDSMTPDSASAALLAVQLECILTNLEVPLAGVPDRSDAEPVTFQLHEDRNKSHDLVLRRGVDGLWRFDRATVDAIPSLHRIVQARQKNLQAERALLREAYTDPRATMRRFLVDALTGDFNAAAKALDLSALSSAERRDRGPALAQQLAFVLQRRGYTYTQLMPDNPNGPAFTWHADVDGRIILERVHPAEGKDAWLFSRHTVANLPKMYVAAQPAQPDLRFVRLGLVVPPLPANGQALSIRERPKSVPPQLGSPRALLMAFFRTMDDADANDGKLKDALQFLDLGAIPPADQPSLGSRLAVQLEAVLRKAQVDLATVPDEWDSGPVVLGENRGMKVEIAKGRDGAWRFSEATIANAPALFEKLGASDRADRETTAQFDTARDTVVTFLNAINIGDPVLAGQCLDLSAINSGAREELGPVLAVKLKYVIDRLGRVYVQEIPDDPEGPRYVVKTGEFGKIVVARRSAEPRAGLWLFTPETVAQIERMFKGALHRPVDESLGDMALVRTEPRFADAPGVWLRLRLPAWATIRLLGLGAYQWFGLVIAATISWWLALAGLTIIHRTVSWLLRTSGSKLTTAYVARKLKPLSYVMAFWLGFQLLELLDLPVRVLNDVLPFKKFLLAGLIGWLGCRLIDLVRAVYADSELMKPHRGLGDMIAPVTVRAAKTCVVLMVATYVIYQVGQGELLGRFLTGLGVAGLAASLAAQDALKSFFGTLLLIGERSFKIGDRILVGTQDGIVEQVGFRSTRLRTPNGSVLTIPNSTIAAAAIDNRGTPEARAA
jgi:MscS family membrane protein